MVCSNPPPLETKLFHFYGEVSEKKHEKIINNQVKLNPLSRNPGSILNEAEETPYTVNVLKFLTFFLILFSNKTGYQSWNSQNAGQNSKQGRF